MNVIKKTVLSLPALLLMVTGCGSGNSTPSASDAPSANSPISTQPVTITLAVPAGWEYDTSFQTLVADQVKAKYPNITVNLVKDNLANGNPPNASKYIANNDVPDIIITSSSQIHVFDQLGLIMDMSPYVKKFNIDLTKFEPAALDASKTADGKLAGFLLNRHYDALYYNKDIFDKFGVAYPKDGMTQEETVELAKRLTRNEANTQYRGYEPGLLNRPSSELGLSFVDPKTGKAAVTSDAWVNFFNFEKTLYTIPGNSEWVWNVEAINQFVKDKRLAMIAINNFLPTLAPLKDMHWGVVSAPTFKENPGKTWSYEGHLAIVSSTSKNKDAAMQVIQSLLSDNSVITLMKQGIMTTNNDTKFQQYFAKDLDLPADTNIKAIFKTTPNKVVYATINDNKELSVMISELKDVIAGKKDVVSSLRDGADQINQLEQQTK